MAIKRVVVTGLILIAVGALIVVPIIGRSIDEKNETERQLLAQQAEEAAWQRSFESRLLNRIENVVATPHEPCEEDLKGPATYCLLTFRPVGGFRKDVETSLAGWGGERNLRLVEPWEDWKHERKSILVRAVYSYNDENPATGQRKYVHVWYSAARAQATISFSDSQERNRY